MRITVRFRRRGAGFQHPLEPAPRTAILAPGFEESCLVRVFPRGWTNAAARFRPTAMAGPVRALKAAARFDVQLQHAVIAFTDLKERLSECDRDFLWQAFGVPVFEQCLGSRNQLLAAECEAHDGLHLWQPAQPEWDGELELGRCACGSTTPRLAQPKSAMVALA